MIYTYIGKIENSINNYNKLIFNSLPNIYIYIIIKLSFNKFFNFKSTFSFL
jgi:hypothetical protein